MDKKIIAAMCMLSACQATSAPLPQANETPSTTQSASQPKTTPTTLPPETANPQTTTEPEKQPLECGRASYYADSLAGNLTANGDIYRPEKLTAAHKTLAFSTVLRVVRQDTDAEVVVTINDRGPFAAGRIIDLSRAAAEAISLIPDDGITKVCIYEAG